MADSFGFDFGTSPSITVIANQTVSIDAAIINTCSTPLDFGCGSFLCGGLSFVAYVTAGPGEGLNALNFSFGSFTPFIGLLLAPNQRFDFVFGTVDFDPSVTIGNPFGTVLHPNFGFKIAPLPGAEAFDARVPTTISIGDQVSFSPITFVAATPGGVVPEPSSLVLLGTGLLGSLALVGFVGIRKGTSERTRS
jgi:hypothetical protein